MNFKVFIFLIFLLPSCTTNSTVNKSSEASDSPLTVILVRHSEKMSNQRDPGLTEQGRERSIHLSEMLEKVSLDAVFSSPYQRTQDTAAPTASMQKLDVIEYDPKELANFATKLKADYKGKTILVVGHSNSTPKLAGLLMNNDIYESFDERDYENIVMVTIPSQGKGKAVFLQY